MLAPLPSAQSITREWIVRIEKQVVETGSSYSTEKQIKSLRQLIKKGSVEFSGKEKLRGHELLSIIQKQFSLDIQSNRIDQIVGIISEKQLDHMGINEKGSIQEQSKLGADFYVLSNNPIDPSFKVKNNILAIPLGDTDIGSNAYYVITSRSGKKFLLSVEEDKTKLRLTFLLTTHADSKAKWKKVCGALPKSILKKNLMTSK